MNSLKNNITLFISILFYSFSFSQTTYFVDQQNGKNSNNGKALNFAFKTFDKAVGVVIPGDVIEIVGIYKNPSYNSNYSYNSESDAHLWHSENTIRIHNLNGSAGNFMIELSTDNGVNWSTIGIATANARSFSWNPSATISDQALIRVTRGGNSDVSDAPFTIIDVPSGVSVDTVCVNGVTVSWNAVPNATSYDVMFLGNKYMDSVVNTTSLSATIPSNPYISYWVSVRARYNSGIGTRANAVFHSAGIKNCVVSDDLEIAIISPSGAGSACSSDSLVVVQITNLGTNDATGGSISYQFNGATTVTQSITNTILSGQSIIDTFNTLAPLTPGVTYDLKTWVSFGADLVSVNDTATSQFDLFSILTLPYSEDFESYASCGIANDCGNTVCSIGNGWINIDNGNGDDIDASWNPIWYTGAKVDDKGWTAEMKIPFSQLRFGKAKEQVWGFNIVRNIFRLNERSLWQRIPNDQSGFVSESGELHGLIDLVSQKQLEIQPFTVLQYDNYQAEAGNPFRDGSDFKINGGLDAKIGITNDLTLDLTINPDFGQVEADPGAIALDGFQIFFREQRPFFVENKNIFDFEFANGRDNLFYSRRIGRNPHRSASLANGEFAKEPINSTILGAAKFSGKTQSGWSIGVLESVTANEYAEIRQTDGNTREEIVEPLTNYFVARTQKDFNDRNTFVGGIFTATNRNLDGNFNELHKAAYTGGIDFKHNWKERNYYIEGNFVGSHVNGSETAIENTQRSLTHLFQRVDANHVSVDPNRTSLTGTGGKLEAGKAGGGNWRYEGGLLWRSPELELNDVGFLRQADEIKQYAEVRRLFLKPTGFYRTAQIGIEQFTTYDFDGNYNRIQYEFEGFINYKNNWWTEAGAAHKPRIFSNTVLRGGPRWRWSDENFAYLFFGSDRRKKFNFTLGYVNSQAAQDNFSLIRYVFRFNYQPFDAFSLSVSSEYEENPNKTQYVTETDFNGLARYITANIDQRTFSTSIRFNYSINPNLSIQYYGQPFISRGTYRDFNYVNNPIAEDLNQRVSVYTDNQITKPVDSDSYLIDENLDGATDYEIDDPDFSFVQFRSNLVLRWEYIPGSEIFLVWSQGVVGSGNPTDTLGKSLDSQILGQKKDNTFLLKATYRFIL